MQTQLSDFQTYIHLSRYARWLDTEGRRETWEETVTRYCDFWAGKYQDFPYSEVWNAIHNMEVMPSMRALMTAGPALDRDNIAGFNCSYIPIVDQYCFDEIMFILMNGTGVGYSVERQYVSTLPTVPAALVDVENIIQIEDSKQGWAIGMRTLVDSLYSGFVPKWDLSLVRAAGARLKTFGGRASGPAPLHELFTFTVELFRRSVGRKLSSVECSDLVCKIAEVVVVGGVRRSALICLSNLSDDRMRNYKNGQWWVDEKQRALANISAAYTENPDTGVFMEEWKALYDSKSGERGIFNRAAAQRQALATGRRSGTEDYGTNPCGEIILRSFGFCNLSEVVVRSTDTEVDLANKVRIAAILGTFQSTLTNFQYIRPEWKKNAEEERLLGVSLTGIMDHPKLSNSSRATEGLLSRLKAVAVATNKLWAGILGIPESAAITTVKPSGTVSQLVDSASGIHPRHNDFYVRTVRADAKDPLALFLVDAGVPNEVDAMNKSNLVFSFPIKAPDGCITRTERSAVEQLEHYLVYQKFWCEHNPSITVYVKEHEWMEVGAWVFKHMEYLGGVSFLPHTDHVYAQAPYQDITKEQYEQLSAAFPQIDWTKFPAYELDDSTISMHEFACVNGACEIL